MINVLKKHRKLILIVVPSLLFVGMSFLVVSSRSSKKEGVPRRPKGKIDSVESLIDPREAWTYKIEKSQEKTRSSLKAVQEENEHLKQTLQNLTSKLDAVAQKSQENFLKARLYQQKDKRGSLNIKTIAQPMRHVTLEEQVEEEEGAHLKNVDTYIPAGTHVPSVILTGVVVGTGVTSQSEPQPIIIRFTNKGIIPGGSSKRFRAGVKDAVLIGSCKGDISSERAFCRINKFTLTEENGEIIEKDVEGWVIGEDGRPGMRGLVVDRSSEVVRLAMLNGVLGGISSFFQQQATSSVYPVSPITGQQNALKGKDLMKAGGYGGVNSALDKMADFAIKRAEQMQPVIVINSGRKVDVVFKKGVDLKDSTLVKRRTQVENRFHIQEKARSIVRKRALMVDSPTL